jgi:acetyltransferase-like isoleucine patch superfamily enzyme
MAELSMAHGLGRLINLVRGGISVLWVMEARFKGVQILGPVRFYGRPILSLARASRLALGPGTNLCSSPRSTTLGCFQPCVLRTLAEGAELVVGANVGMSSTVLCAGLSIRVGDNTLLGAGTMVFDNDFHVPDAGPSWRPDSQTNARPVVIGKDAFIGARAIVLKGVTIGDGAMVGAGAVVTKDVPAGRIAVGNPARVLPLRPAAT